MAEKDSCFQLQSDLNEKKRKQSKVEVPGIQAGVWENAATVDGRSLIRDLEKYFNTLSARPGCIFSFLRKGISRSITFNFGDKPERGRRPRQVDTRIYEDTLQRPSSPESPDQSLSGPRPSRQSSLSPNRVTC